MKVAACPEDEHEDLLLEPVFLGAGGGLPRTVSAHEGIVFDENVDGESDLPSGPLLRGGMDDSRALQMMSTQFMPKSRGENRGEEVDSLRMFHVSQCRYGR